MHHAAIVVLHVHDGRTGLFLPAYGEQAVAEGHDSDSDDLGVSEGTFLDLELSCLTDKRVSLAWKFG